MHTNRHQTLVRIFSCVALFAAACAPAAESGPGPAVDDDHDEAAESAPNLIEVPATVRSNLGITFATVEARRVEQTLRIPGAIELRPLARREYRMALPGRIELLVDQNDPVEQDQPLFRFQSPSWPELLHEIINGEQAIEAALAEIEVSEAKGGEARKKLELMRERLDALTEAEFRDAGLEAEAAELQASLPRLEAELKLARTRLANARLTREHALHRASTAANIPEEELEQPVPGGDPRVPAYRTIDWIEVRAAAPGIVEALAVTDGAFVEPPAMVLSVVDPEQVRFRGLALQGDLPALLDVTEATIVLPREGGSGAHAAGFGAGVSATMSFGLEAHPQERTLTVLARPTELARWIRPGTAAFLEVVVDDTATPVLAIPRSAVVQDGLEHVFFRRDPSDPDHVLRVEADLGVSDGWWIEVQSGLMRGDEVVLDGAYELKLAFDQRGASGQQGTHVHADGTVH